MPKIQTVPSHFAHDLSHIQSVGIILGTATDKFYNPVICGAPGTSNMMAGQLINQITQILAYGRLPLCRTVGVYHRVLVMIHDSSTQSIHNFQMCIGTAHGCDDDVCLAVGLPKLFTLDIFHHYGTCVQNMKVFADLGLISQKVIQLLIVCDVCHLGHVATLFKLSIKGVQG